MFAVVQNGQVIKIVQPDIGFTVGEKSYSPGFLRNSTLAEKKAAGVWDVVDSNRPDDRYYWVGGPEYRANEVAEVVETVYTANPKALEDKLETKEDGTPLFVQVYDEATQAMVDTAEQVVSKGLKSTNVVQNKATAGSLLANTDWYVVRKAEVGTEVPANVAAFRDAVRAECNRVEASILAATSIEDLIAVQANYPVLK